MAMVDICATHNFVADRETQMLGLTLTQHSSRLKAVNSEAKPIQGIASADFEVGTWKGKCSLMAVPLDDFDVILGMDFLLLAKATVIPYLSGLFIADVNCPSFVQAAYRFARTKQQMLDEAKDSLAKAQRRMKKYAEMGRRQVEFKADATWENGVDLWQFERQLVKYWASRGKSCASANLRCRHGAALCGQTTWLGRLAETLAEMLAETLWPRYWPRCWSNTGRDAGRVLAEMLAKTLVELAEWCMVVACAGKLARARRVGLMQVSVGAGRRVAEPVECCARRQHRRAVGEVLRARTGAGARQAGRLRARGTPNFCGMRECGRQLTQSTTQVTAVHSAASLLSGLSWSHWLFLIGPAVRDVHCKIMYK
ncbi:hypothetical protein Salat_1134600 [Sesamum alatum]|uniref:Uncharacterized protein n=1 Tax=Sesamum alatum TaxID=300844 RepID=A0AAE1YDM9_9LAMI|nr:hypothetical protein Salat_1134600 [Sesamum alatum]